MLFLQLCIFVRIIKYKLIKNTCIGISHSNIVLTMSPSIEIHSTHIERNQKFASKNWYLPIQTDGCYYIQTYIVLYNRALKNISNFLKVSQNFFALSVSAYRQHLLLPQPSCCIIHKTCRRYGKAQAVSYKYPPLRYTASSSAYRTSVILRQDRKWNAPDIISVIEALVKKLCCWHNESVDDRERW